MVSSTRSATKVAESAAPCILWLDELEKGLSGVKSSGMSDGGTTARVFGYLLTWLQEKQAAVFTIATSNDITALPPELLRAGRFDDIFFVDLPNPQERAEIWTIHVTKAARNPADFDVAALVAVQQALHYGFSESREINTQDLATAISERVPLTETMSEQIAYLRGWVKRRAKPASSAGETATAEGKKRGWTCKRE